MTKAQFKDYVFDMVDRFGVRSCFDNDEEDDLWFECPICGEPILYEDYGIDDEDTLLRKQICPVCEEEFDAE